MSTQETALAICQRIRGRTHFSQISIGPDMQLTDQFQIIIQHFIKVFAFFSCLGQNHRQMQGYRTDIKTSHKYRLILVICRMHAASLIPWRQKCSASHGRYDLAILLVHACHIALAGKTQPVGIHGLGRAFHTCLENILQRLSGAVQILII